MKVREASLDDVADVCARMRDHNARELAAGRFPPFRRRDIAREIAARHPLRIRVECFLTDAGIPAAICGAWLTAPQFAQLQMVMTDDWGKIARAAVKHLRKRFIPAELVPNVRRAEVTVMDAPGYPTAWLHFLGFKVDGVMRARFHPGEDFLLLSWTNPFLEGANGASATRATRGTIDAPAPPLASASPASALSRSA